MNKRNLFITGTIAAVIVATGIWLGAGVPAPQVSTSETVNLKDGDTYTLTASYVTKEVAGKKQKMLAYNGMIPGPTIRVQQGATVTINFNNDTDLPALLHSHGVRMDSAFDGAQTSQTEIPPGGTFAYTLKFPDAGVYWYHPHANEVYTQPLGLYGAFVVEPANADYFPPVNREEMLFLSDLPIENGKIAISKAGNDYALMGHYGNVLLVNGEEKYALNATVGEVVRFYVINSGNARPFNFRIAGAKMKMVGGDSGAYERPFFTDSVVLGPSERAIVDVLFTKAGAYEVHNKTPDTTYALGTVTVNDEVAQPSYARSFNSLAPNTAAIASIDPFRKYFAMAPNKKISLTVDMMGMGNHAMHGMMTSASDDGIEWEDTSGMMNAMSTVDMVKWHIVDQDTGRKSMNIDDWIFKKGAPVKIRIENDPKSMHPMQHPIHFHGQRFLVVARDGVQQTNLVWKDTVLVKSGETVDIILDPSNPGEWMAHCHISEHLAAGMMFSFKVE